LEYARTLFAASVERSGNPDLGKVRDWIQQNEKALAEAKKDNDFIYHEPVPEIKTLAPIGKAAVAKATSPLPTKFGTETSKDLFEELCPVAIHQALSAYDARRQELVGTNVTKLKDATNLLNQLLSSMNMPAALEDTKGGEVPQSVREKATAVAGAGGHAALKKLIAELPGMRFTNL
jgi:programmed cell death 6-interacting protein